MNHGILLGSPKANSHHPPVIPEDGALHARQFTASSGPRSHPLQLMDGGNDPLPDDLPFDITVGEKRVCALGDDGHVRCAYSSDGPQ
jgi:hypothetical protein